MTDFLHKREHLKAGDTAVLDCDTQCNFMLLTDSQFVCRQIKLNFLSQKISECLC